MNVLPMHNNYYYIHVHACAEVRETYLIYSTLETGANLCVPQLRLAGRIGIKEVFCLQTQKL